MIGHTLRGCVDWNTHFYIVLNHFPESHPTWVCGLKLYRGATPCIPSDVTPYVGVWIETMRYDPDSLESGSHPTWVCGLKRYWQWKSNIDTVSHPTWVCGLKQPSQSLLFFISGSHPTWVCGLKQWWGEHVYRQPVTPYVGVWIETSIIIFFKVRKSHTLRGCVDWNAMIFTIFVSSWQSHPTWVCGLKHPHVIVFKTIVKSHPTWVCGLKPPVPCYVPKV